MPRTRINHDFTYYDYHPLLSRGAYYSGVIGARGLGKTFGAKKKVIKDYLRYGDEFIYLRRFQTEQQGKDTFFNDIAKEFPNHRLRVNGLEAQITDDLVSEKPKWETFGYFRVLSKAQSQKGVSYHNVATIIFDEFIIEKGFTRYIPDEVNAFNNFYMTVDRSQGRCRVLMLANAISSVNPYFIAWGIIPGEKEFVRFGDGFGVFHFADSSEYENQLYETPFGKFIKNTAYGDYAAGNVFHDMADYLILKKDSNAKYKMSIETELGTFSVWEGGMGAYGTYFAQEKRPSNERIWTMEPRLMTPDKVLVERNNNVLQLLRASYSRGTVFFDSSKTRNMFSHIFKW